MSKRNLFILFSLVPLFLAGCDGGSSSSSSASEYSSSDEVISSSEASSSSVSSSIASSSSEVIDKTKVTKVFNATSTNVTCNLEAGDELIQDEEIVVKFTSKELTFDLTYGDYRIQIGRAFLPLSLDPLDNHALMASFIADGEEVTIGLCSSGSSSALVTASYEEKEGVHVYGFEQNATYDGYYDTFLIEVDDGYLLNSVYYMTADDPISENPITYDRATGLCSMPYLSLATTIVIHFDCEYKGTATINYGSLEDVVVSEAYLPEIVTIGSTITLYVPMKEGKGLEALAVTGDKSGDAVDVVRDGYDFSFVVPEDEASLSINITSKEAAPINVSGEHLRKADFYSDYALTKKVRAYDPDINSGSYSLFAVFELEEGYLISSVTASDSSVSLMPISDYYMVMIKNTFSGASLDINVTASLSYEVSVADFEGGSISLNKTAYAAGEAVSLTATILDSYLISNVVDANDAALSIDFDNTGYNWAISFTMPEHDVCLVVTTEEKSTTTLTLTINGDEDGISYLSLVDSSYNTILSGAGVTEVRLGEVYTIYISAASGYSLSSLTLTENGNASDLVGSSGSYRVTFSANKPIITINVSKIAGVNATIDNPNNLAGYINGSYSISGDLPEFYPGSTFSLSITGSIGYKVNVYIDEVLQSPSTTGISPMYYSLAVPANDFTIRIEQVALSQHSVTIVNKASNNGSVTYFDYYGSFYATGVSAETDFEAYEGARLMVYGYDFSTPIYAKVTDSETGEMIKEGNVYSSRPLTIESLESDITITFSDFA